MTDEKSLTKREPQNALAQIHERYGEEKYNLLLPKVHVGRLPQGTTIAIREVNVNPDEKAGDVFPVDGGKKALLKTTLDRIAAAAGVTWQAVERTDDRGHPHYCEFTARGRVTDFDGTVREAIGTKTIDLRDDDGNGTPGKDRAGMKDRQLAGARKFMTEMCASKAMNRAIASVLAIKRSYSPDELRRPFIVPKLVPDTSHPVAQKAIIAGMVGAGEAASRAIYETPQSVVEAEFEDEGSARTEVLQPPAGGEEPGEEAPPASPGSSAETGTRQVIEAVKSAWAKASGAGMAPEAFKKLCESQTGKQTKEEMTLEEAQMLDGAVEGYIANKDDVPV